ncbi:MAG: CBS domain-containing protein [Candidatus Nezhaarchaeota archaeon]|nr:CBS domain-containing protein [Candidatus Nezhaarchaeota archaeon]
MSLPILVREIMSPSIVSVEGASTVRDAAQLMVEREVGSVIVTEAGRPVGILTERDVLRRVVMRGLDPSKVKVREVMSSPLITVKADAYIIDAGRLMADRNIRRLLVVEGDRPVGVVTQKDVCRALNKYVGLGLSI